MSFRDIGARLVADGSEDVAVLESVKIAKSVGKLTRSQIRARRLPNGAVDMPHLSQVQYEALQRSKVNDNTSEDTNTVSANG